MSQVAISVSAVPRENLLLAVLPLHERERLSAFIEDVEVQRGQVLVEVNEPIDYIWFPRTCVTSTVVDVPEGATIEVGLMGYEGLAGLSLFLGPSHSSTTVAVQIGGRAGRMRAREALDYVIEPRTSLYAAVMRYVDAFVATVAQTAACNSQHSVEQRLARWILMTQDRVQSGDMALTQEFLAYTLGVRRASVSIAASALQQLGLIHYNRGHLRVTQRGGLEQRSCACYSVVRRIVDRLALDGLRPQADVGKLAGFDHLA